MLSPAVVAATWRFVAMVLNFVVHVVVFYSRVDLLQSSLTDPDDSRSDSAYADLQEQFLGVWSFANICFAVQMLSLLAGLTTQLVRLCTSAAALHTCGMFFNLWAVADAWAIQRWAAPILGGPRCLMTCLTWSAFRLFSYFVTASFFIIFPATFDVAVLLYRLLRVQAKERLR